MGRREDGEEGRGSVDPPIAAAIDDVDESDRPDSAAVQRVAHGRLSGGCSDGRSDRVLLGELLLLLDGGFLHGFSAEAALA